METIKKTATLTIMRYPAWGIPFAFLSMVIFRIPLFFNKKITFWRLMGSGKSGTFDKVPDLRQWAVMAVHPQTINDEGSLKNAEKAEMLIKKSLGIFIAGWTKIFCNEFHAYVLDPIEGHGLWNGKQVFGDLPKSGAYEGEIAVMTRATIRLNKMGRFWSHVEEAAKEMATAPGFIKSYGIGEWPWIKQATFSIWESKEAMRQFAYKSNHHKDIIRKTHSEGWYSEEMFVRFKILAKF
jgi:hypothetical protein